MMFQFYAYRIFFLSFLEHYRPRANVHNHFLYIISLDWVLIFFLL